MKKKRQEIREDTIDFRALISKFIKKWYWFVIAIIIAYFSAIAYIKFYTEPVYRVSAYLLAKDESATIKGIGATSSYGSSKNLSNEIAIIRSFDVVWKVMEELDFGISYYHKGKFNTKEFYHNSPIKVVLDSNSYQIANAPFYITFLGENKYKLESYINSNLAYDVKTDKSLESTTNIYINEIIEFGVPYKNKNIGFTVFVQNPYFVQNDTKLFFTINDRTNLTLIYKNKLNITQQSKESSLLELSTSGPLLQKDIEFINKTCETYVQYGLDEKTLQASKTINFIDEQLESISRYLKNADEQMESFRTKNKIADVDKSTKLAYTKLEGLETQKASIQLNIKYYHYILDYIQSNKDFKAIVAPSAIGIGDPLLSNLIGQLISLKTERIAIESSSTKKNPVLQNLDERISNVKQTLEENLKNIISGTELTLKDLNFRISEIEEKLEILPQTERLYLEVQRKYNLNDNLYTYLLEKRAEAAISRASSTPDARILDKARLQTSPQIAPKTNLIYTAFFMIILIIPIIIIIVNDFLNNKIMSKSDLESITDLPILGIIGHSKIKSNLAVYDKPKSGIAEAFRSIRINLNYLLPDKVKKVVTITSSISGEGKTFCSINLASILSLSGYKTILIGADLRKPKIFDDFGFNNLKGMSNYLAGRAQLEDIINTSKFDNLDVLLSGPVPPNPAELLNNQRMDTLIEELKLKYDYIVIDTPPIGLVADCFILMKYSDINIYIVRHGYTETRLLEKVDSMYEEGKISNMNIIINDLIDTDAKYGYGYEYGYGYYNGYGYYEEDNDSMLKKAKEWIQKLRNKTTS
ncbi:MAG: polysaccharide biosynthesis tyrosine autokinase [Cytophagales bacterium]|nr:MAG: polysaccharide biosynthesis tyrosine autokinase [Cytophagales bacterium]